MIDITDEARERQMQAGLPATFLRDLRLTFAAVTNTLFLTFSVKRSEMWVPQLAFRSTEAPTYTDVVVLVKDSIPQLGSDAESVRGISSFAVTSSGTAFCMVSRFARVRDDVISLDLDAIVKIPFPFTECDTWGGEEIRVLNCYPGELLGANDEGPYAQTGLNMTRYDVNSAESSWYGVAHFLWDSRKVKKLASLPNIFF